MPSSIKILIADDNSSIREGLKDILSEKDYLTETASNGYELLENIRKQKPHIIILDLMMPEKDGVEILPAIKCVVPDVKIIIYTAFSRYENSVYVEMADKFLLKTDSPEDIIKVIDGFAKEIPK